MRLGLYLGSIKLKIATCMLPLMLAGCASLAGSPPRVMGVAPSMELVNRYPIPGALRAFANPADPANLREGLSQQQYRNMVITVYLNAIDAQYYEWRAQVSDERRELGTGFDASVIALTGAASVARQSLVRSLSAAASIMAGTRGTIDRNIYFDRALPGLLAAMDTQRLRVRTEITRHMADTPADYPLASAFADISAYELAASLDRAIEEITAQASAQRQVAQQQYENALQACDTEEDIEANITRIMTFVRRRQQANDLPALQALATLMGLAPGANAAAIRTQVRNDLIQNYCTNQKLARLISSVLAETWGSTI